MANTTNAKSNVDKLSVANSAKYYLGKTLELVNEELKEAGFTTIIIKETVKEKKWLSFLSKEAAVTRISINGQTDFSKGDTFAKDAVVKITYNTYK